MNGFNHPTKIIIREKWCKPLLRIINKDLGYKFIYLGLPGIEAFDIISWIDYLDKIIAFQCREYPKPSHPSQSKIDIDRLDTKLREFERKGLINSYSLYDGWMEEVILRGRDLNGNPFSQSDIITIYNLDFCNSLTVPLNIPDDQGNINKYYKLDVISKLLEFQRDINSIKREKKFIVFLTVHSQFWKNEAEKLLNRSDSNKIKIYIESISNSNLKNSDKNIRFLKAYVFSVLKTHFCSRKFIPEFLPPIYYHGIGSGQDNWLLLFTILGTYSKDPSGIAPCYQTIESFLQNKFLQGNKLKISLLENKISELSIETDPEKLLQMSNTYKIWSNNL